MMNRLTLACTLVCMALGAAGLGGCSDDCDGCMIGSTCVTAGTVDPDNPCRSCDPDASTSAWSEHEGTACDDGLFCTIDDTCTGGACAGTARSCSDEVACNGEERCDEEAQACLPGASQCPPTELCDVNQDRCVASCHHCAIEGFCYYDFQANPLDPCQICDHALDPYGWSDADGAPCDDGLFCNGADECAAGSCSVHGGTPCADDGLFCNGSELCDEESDLCSHAYDACGAEQSCDEGQAQCCDRRAQLACSADDDVVWLDSCGREEALVEECADAPQGTCSASACLCLPGWTGEGCSRCVIHVAPSGDDANGGASFGDAMASLNAAITAASLSGCEVWVAEGTYNPHPSDRTVSFQMVDGVDLYGGFAGDETTRAERDIDAHPTILSGEIGDPSLTSDNTRHVVRGADAVLDGFIISGGEADWTAMDDQGGGMLIENSSPIVSRCTFRNNTAGGTGGGVFMVSSSASFRSCRFEQNAGVGGGGMAVAISTPLLFDLSFVGNDGLWRDGGGLLVEIESNRSITCDNCLFDGNTASGNGGAVGVWSGAVTFNNALLVDNDARDGGGIWVRRTAPMILRNVTVVDNHATTQGGGLLAGTVVVVTNSIFWGNSTGDATATVAEQQIAWSRERPYIRFSAVAGDAPFPGDGNIHADPLFVDTNAGDLRLQSVSPCVDAGFAYTLLADTQDIDADGDTEEPLPLDLDGNPRVVGEEVDMGAYER